MQVLQNIPGYSMTDEQLKRHWNNAPSFRNGKSNSYAFTSGIDETIFIFKELYRRNFSTIIKGKIIIHFSPAYLQS